jgi:hypothetical protein
MPRKPGTLNTRVHLDHLQLIFDGLDKYGMCPLVEAEIAKARVVNTAILAKHDGQRARGNRKDIVVEKKR